MTKFTGISGIILLTTIVALFIMGKVNPDASMAIVALTFVIALSSICMIAGYIYNTIKGRKA